MIQMIHHSKVKRDFLVAFSKDPVNYLKKFITSQNQEMQLILGDLSVNKEEARRAEFYQGEWVDEAIRHYLNARTL